MFLKHRVEDRLQEETKTPESMQSIYLAAYRYSLELCENPEIAREVAACFLASMEVKEQSSSASDWGKPRAVACPDVAILC